MSEQEEPAGAWGQPISEDRQRELQGYLDRWESETDHGERKGPFHGVRTNAYLDDLDGLGDPLSGADVAWLAAQRADPLGLLSNLHLEGANLIDAHLEGSVLTFAHLEGAHLEGAHLEGAHLGLARLEGAYLGGADLAGAVLNSAHLEGADLEDAQFDSRTRLTDASLNDRTSLCDIEWGGVGVVNLTKLNWDAVPTLGDERKMGFGTSVRSVMKNGKVFTFAPHPKSEGVTRREAQNFVLWRDTRAVRAYRQLAVQLRAQGLSEVADRFLFRAQARQRGVFLRRRRIPQWLGSGLLALLAGYGYRPGRTILWYLAVVLGFAALYLTFGVVDGHAFNLTEAAVFSVTSFHGRGFFPGNLKLDDPVTVLAAIEAVIGLVIEISFIATFTQRFFNSR